MDELQALLKSWQWIAAFITGSVLTMLLRWWRIRERAWMFKTRRQKRLRELFKDGKWRSAQPFDLSSALEDAFAKTIETPDLMFIESRKRSWRLLNDRMHAGYLVELAATRDGFMDARSEFWRRWTTFTGASIACMIVTSLVFPLGATGAFLAWRYGGPIAGSQAVIWWIGIVVLFFRLSLMLDAAHRVVSLKHHPPEPNLPPVPEKGKGSKKGTKRKENSKTDGKRKNRAQASPAPEQAPATPAAGAETPAPIPPSGEA